MSYFHSVSSSHKNSTLSFLLECVKEEIMMLFCGEGFLFILISITKIVGSRTMKLKLLPSSWREMHSRICILCYVRTWLNAIFWQLIDFFASRSIPFLNKNGNGMECARGKNEDVNGVDFFWQGSKIFRFWRKKEENVSIVIFLKILCKNFLEFGVRKFTIFWQVSKIFRFLRNTEENEGKEVSEAIF